MGCAKVLNMDTRFISVCLMHTGYRMICSFIEENCMNLFHYSCSKLVGIKG
jgi:hypothetical protein